jgi:hypothetical protein
MITIAAALAVELVSLGAGWAIAVLLHRRTR